MKALKDDLSRSVKTRYGQNSIPAVGKLVSQLNQCMDRFQSDVYKGLLDQGGLQIQHRHNLIHVKKNCISDVPYVNLTIPRRAPTALVARGTNKVEEWNRDIGRVLRGHKHSPPVANALLKIFIHEKNVRQGRIVTRFPCG